MAIAETGNVIAGTVGTPLRHAGAPTNDVTFVGQAAVGTLLLDTTNGVLYVATVATATTVTWVIVGTQS